DQVTGAQILRTRRFVRRFLEQYFAPNDLGAVVFLGRADHSKEQGLTSNPRLLLDSVNAFSGGFSQEAPPPTLSPVQGGGGAPARSSDFERELPLREAMGS